MANLDSNVKKLKRGETVGFIATVFCGAVLVYFIICFVFARVNDNKGLELATLISAPLLMLAGIAVASFCNLRYGGAIDRAVKNYVINQFVENAALMHPERNALAFYLSLNESRVELRVNGYKEKIVFDFSELGKFTLSRRASALSEIENRLCATFCRLFDKGADYTEVSYAEDKGKKRKAGKTVFIIKNGSPEKKAYKQYLKNK